MAEFFVFFYAFLASFVIRSMGRDRRLQRPSAPALTMVGWGLFSLSSTLAVLLGGLAVAIAFGFNAAGAGLVLPA